MTDKNRQLADELLLDLLERMRLKYPNDKDYGREVRGLLVRVGNKVGLGNVGLN